MAEVGHRARTGQCRFRARKNENGRHIEGPEGAAACCASSNEWAPNRVRVGPKTAAVSGALDD